MAIFGSSRSLGSEDSLEKSSTNSALLKHGRGAHGEEIERFAFSPGEERTRAFTVDASQMEAQASVRKERRLEKAVGVAPRRTHRGPQHTFQFGEAGFIVDQGALERDAARTRSQAGEFEQVVRQRAGSFDERTRRWLRFACPAVFAEADHGRPAAPFQQGDPGIERSRSAGDHQAIVFRDRGIAADEPPSVAFSGHEAGSGAHEGSKRFASALQPDCSVIHNGLQANARAT